MVDLRLNKFDSSTSQNKRPNTFCKMGTRRECMSTKLPPGGLGPLSNVAVAEGTLHGKQHLNLFNRLATIQAQMFPWG